jgi:hypothetical protein
MIDPADRPSEVFSQFFTAFLLIQFFVHVLI